MKLHQQEVQRPESVAFKQAREDAKLLVRLKEDLVSQSRSTKDTLEIVTKEHEAVVKELTEEVEHVTNKKDLMMHNIDESIKHVVTTVKHVEQKNICLKEKNRRKQYPI